MESKVTRKSINELSPESRILIQYLTKHLIEDKQDVVTYQEMSAAIGRNVQTEARGKLNTARKHVETENQITIGTVSRVGVKITGDYEGIADNTLKSIGRKTRRTCKRILNVKIGDLPDDRKTAVFSRVSTLGAINQFAKPSSVKKIEGKVKELGNVELPVKETVKMFE